MKKWLMLMLVITSSMTFAGNEAGNGGVSIVCRDANERILKSELLDLFEGRELHSLRYSKDDLSVETIIDLVEVKLIKFPDFLTKLQEELTQIEKKIVFIREGIELNPTNDAFPVINLKGCGYEQLANYTHEGYLFVSKEIYDSLDVRNKAALYVHEAVYKLRRDMGDKNSRNARLLTAHLMASNSDLKVIEDLVGASIKPPTAVNGKPVCGLTGTLEARIRNCNSLFNGFALVSRFIEGDEIHKDLSTGLIWSSHSRIRRTFSKRQEACHPNNPVLGNIPNLSWKVPSDKELIQAQENGFGFLMKEVKFDYFEVWLKDPFFFDQLGVVWTSTKNEGSDKEAYAFSYATGKRGLAHVNRAFSVSCVAEEIGL